MQRKPPRRTRERILERSLRLFNDLGEPNVTTSAIADEMNISPGNLYYHFRNKDDIVNALFDRFEAEVDGLLEAPRDRPVTFEDAWLFLHLLFESIWRFRFLYRDLNDLLSRNRRVEIHFKAIIDRKTVTAQRLCRGLVASGEMRAGPGEIDALAHNMALVATYWLSFEYIRHARRFNDPRYQADAMARGAYHVMAMVAPYLSEAGRTLFERLAREYLEEPSNR